MNNKEDKPPVLTFGTKQVCLLKFNSQVDQGVKFKSVFSSEMLRLPIARYCLRSSGFRVRTVEFSVKS